MDKHKLKIAFFDAKPYDRKFFDEANREYGYELKYFEPRLSPDTVKMAAGYDVVCVFVNDNVNQEVIDTLVAGGTRLLALRCAGYNNVNLYAAFAKLPVVRVPAYSPYAVAEHAAALLLTLNRKTHRAYNRVRDSNFTINGLLGFDIHGKKVGIVGTGKIGKIFGQIMRGFGADLLAHDAYHDEAFISSCQAQYVDLPTLYRDADIISLHCPLTPETHHLISFDAIGKMKPGVILLNTSRGSLIDAPALIDGLKSGMIGGAGLDVYEEESDYFFFDKSDKAIEDDTLARLLTFPNVLITSHQAFFTAEAMTNIANTTLQNVHDFDCKRILTNGICSQCDGTRSCPGKKLNATCKHQ